MEKGLQDTRAIESRYLCSGNTGVCAFKMVILKVSVISKDVSESPKISVTSLTAIEGFVSCDGARNCICGDDKPLLFRKTQGI